MKLYIVVLESILNRDWADDHISNVLGAFRDKSTAVEKATKWATREGCAPHKNQPDKWCDGGDIFVTIQTTILN